MPTRFSIYTSFDSHNPAAHPESVRGGKNAPRRVHLILNGPLEWPRIMSAHIYSWLLWRNKRASYDEIITIKHTKMRSRLFWDSIGSVLWSQANVKCYFCFRSTNIDPDFPAFTHNILYYCIVYECSMYLYIIYIFMKWVKSSAQIAEGHSCRMKYKYHWVKVRVFKLSRRVCLFVDWLWSRDLRNSSAVLLVLYLCGHSLVPVSHYILIALVIQSLKIRNKNKR